MEYSGFIPPQPGSIWLIFASGFKVAGSQYEQAVQMLRLTFPYLFFISLTALFSGVLNSYGKFAVPAFTQVLMNVTMIVFTIRAALYVKSACGESQTDCSRRP